MHFSVNEVSGSVVSPACASAYDFTVFKHKLKRFAVSVVYRKRTLGAYAVFIEVILFVKVLHPPYDKLSAGKHHVLTLRILNHTAETYFRRFNRVMTFTADKHSVVVNKIMAVFTAGIDDCIFVQNFKSAVCFHVVSGNCHVGVGSGNRHINRIKVL